MKIEVKLNLTKAEIEKMNRILAKRGISADKLVENMFKDWLFNRFC